MSNKVQTTGIVWFRQDLRVADNPALSLACRECTAVLCIFIDDPQQQSVSQLGEASRVWLHHSLHSLNASLNVLGNELLFFQGNSLDVLKKLGAQSAAMRLYWNRCYDPLTIQRDKIIKAELSHLQPKTANGLLIFEPWQNLKNNGEPYRVYTPFWRAASAQLSKSIDSIKTIAAPRSVPALDATKRKRIASVRQLGELSLLPEHPWSEFMMSHWSVGEAAAARSLKKFLKTAVLEYDDARNCPAVSGTSCLSPHLHFGEIGPRQILLRLLGKRAINDLEPSEEVFAKEIIWREFAYSLLFHFPHTIDKPLDKRFNKFPWAKRSTKNLQAWQRGMTGVPIVDAGMRELYSTGWMHNRVRMIVASYLIKNLLIPWQSGEQWFRNTLVDADLASNTMGWQWSAGSGADAAPFFRVFNPVLQGEKFDKNGHYVRRWVPEIATLPDKYIHKPWEMSESERAALTYPAPLVDLKATRLRALDAFTQIKGNQSG